MKIWSFGTVKQAPLVALFPLGVLTPYVVSPSQMGACLHPKGAHIMFPSVGTAGGSPATHSLPQPQTKVSKHSKQQISHSWTRTHVRSTERRPVSPRRHITFERKMASKPPKIYPRLPPLLLPQTYEYICYLYCLL